MYQVVVIILLVLLIFTMVMNTFSLADSILEEEPTTRTLVTKGALWGTLMMFIFMCIYMLD